MHIAVLSADQEQAWNAYVRHSPTASLYHLIEWKRVIERTFGHRTFYLYAVRDERIVGILPLTLLKSRLFGTFIVSLPFFNYAGIVAETEESQQGLVEQAIDIARRESAEHIELRHREPYDLNLPMKTSKVLMVFDLPPTPDELWKSFKSKLRSQIRRPEKEGLTVQLGQLEELDSFYDVFVHNMRDLGTPVYPRQLFEHVLREFPETARICTVYAETRPVASGLVIGYKQRLQIPWASSLRAYNRFSPNMMMYWHILKYACEQGYTQFDFGRSTPNEGTYKFKKQWGAQPVQCYWHYWLAGGGGELPELNPHNPKYAMAIKTWQCLPLPVTKWLGPHIVKYLP